MPAPPIPTEIRTVLEARDALLQYAKTLPNPPGLHLGFDLPITRPFAVANRLLADLERHSGLGPVVKAQPDSGPTHLVGRSEVPAGREVLPLVLPDGPLDRYLHDLPGTLASATASAGIAFALAGRCEQVAETYRGGRTRQTKQLLVEAHALAAFGDELSAVLPDLGDMFLAEWSRQAAARGPSTPAPPPVHAVNLR